MKVTENNDPITPLPDPGPTKPFKLPDNLLKWLQILGIMLGIGLGGTALYKKSNDPLPDVFIVPKEYKAKKCEMNSLTIVSQVPVTFFIPDDTPMTYKITGNTIDFVPKTFPVKFYVTAVSNNAMLPPKIVTIVADTDPAPNPPPGPQPAPLPNPSDPFESALRTGWQAEFSPDKSASRLKLIQLYQYLLTQVTPTMTYGDLANKLVTKANELQVVGRAPAFQTALNVELGKLIPHSPSILVDATVVNTAFNRAITVMQMLTP